MYYIQYIHRSDVWGPCKIKKKEVSYAHQGCIYLIKNTVKQFKITNFYCNIF